MPCCRKAKSIEFMMVDALKHADDIFHFTEAIWDPREFVQLSDSLMYTIESYGKGLFDRGA